MIAITIQNDEIKIRNKSLKRVKRLRLILKSIQGVSISNMMGNSSKRDLEREQPNKKQRNKLKKLEIIY